MIIENDVDGLSRLFKEMTKYIPSVNDNNLINYLKSHVKSIEKFYINYGDNITDIVNRLAERETYYSYFKIFTAILKYFLLAVQKFCQRNI
jgi:hypothetical protein